MEVFALKSHKVESNAVTLKLINDEGFENQRVVFNTPQEATLKNAILAYENQTGNFIHTKL